MLFLVAGHRPLRRLRRLAGIHVEPHRFAEKLGRVAPVHFARLFNLRCHRRRDADSKALVVWVWHGERPRVVRIVLRDGFPCPLAPQPLAPLRRAHDGLDRSPLPLLPPAAEPPHPAVHRDGVHGRFAARERGAAFAL